MKRYYKRKKYKPYKKRQKLFDVINPIILACFGLFICLSMLSGFNLIAIIIFAIIFALIPNAYSLYKTYKKRQKYINMDIPEIDNLTGYEFEELLRNIL